MSNAILSYPDNTLTATLRGGSWLSTLPLSNLKNKLLSKKTRSTNALAASTLLYVDLGSALAVRVISLLSHNISIAGTIQAQGYSDSGYTTLVTGADTGAVTAWPSGFTAQNALDYPQNWTFVFPSAKSARYWKIEITDTTNAAGYIEIGRLWIGEATLEPTTGISYGATLGYEPQDVIETSLGGVDWGEEREARRVATVTLGNVSEAEKPAVLMLQKKLGRIGELMFVMNALDTPTNMLLQAFPATISTTSPLSYPYFNNHELPLTLKEII